MDTPGSLLKAEREKQKQSLSDIESLLKINIEYLRAIEQDDYERLPGDIFVRSYLRSYSGVLGLDAGAVLQLYNKCFKEPSAAPPPPKRPMRDMLSRLKPLYIYLVPACIIIALIWAGLYTKQNTEQPEPLSVAKPPQEVKDIRKEKIYKETPEPIEKTAPEEELSLEIHARELTWVSVKIDSGGAEEHLLRAGESKTLTAHEKFVIKVGNAGGTSLILNGNDIGPLGPHGQVAEITLP